MHKSLSLLLPFLFAFYGQSLAQQDSTLIQADSMPRATVRFDSAFYDFGTVREGAMVKHTFHFQNTGDQPYVIQDVKTSCGCTVPIWPKDTIPPGASGEINVEFNTNGKMGLQLKVIRVIGNSDPPQAMLQMSGEVRPGRKRKNKGH